ncbi:mobilization protein [Campylobacter rectus]|uniref:mobilization protein n=1 Tax=Campylobacter rectus TaxID=203 RepID=UPI0028E42D06|nr:mobilization protein [Campylobacter rectus]
MFHNANIRPSYVIGGKLECNRKGYEAKELKEAIVNEAKQTYKQRTKRAFQSTAYEWSAVVNIKPDTTMQDLERLSKHFSDKYGFQCYQIAIHRDEGHIDENGERQINHHAHLEFITLDKQTGRNRQRELKPQTLRQIQSEVAEILGMQRGIDKRISKAERIEPRKYAKLKEAEKKAIKTTQRETEKEAIEAFKAVSESEERLLNDKEKSEYLEQLRKQYKGKGLSAAFFRELGAIKKDKETQYTQKELDEAVKKAIEADREKQKPINRQEFEQQTTKELKAYTEAGDQKPIISPFLQSLITLLPKDSETIRQLEKELKKEEEEHYNDIKIVVTAVAKRLNIDTSNTKRLSDIHKENLKALDAKNLNFKELENENQVLKSEINTLKTQNKALQEQNDIKDNEIIKLKQENATAVKFDDLKAYFNLIDYRDSFENERPNTISGDFRGKDREIDAKYSHLPLFDEFIKPNVLSAKKAHLEIMQEKERKKTVSQKIIKKDTGRSF